MNFRPLGQFLFKKTLRFEKRYRFVTSALLMTGLMMFSTAFYFNESFIFIPALLISSYALTLFSVLQGIEKVEWFTLFIMPVTLTLSFYLIYFLFPSRWLTRFPFVIIYGISIYAIFLCSNIFNVGVEKSLQLYRAAFSVNFFYQTLVSFLFYNIILSFRLNFLFNGLLIGIVTTILGLQLLWTVKLDAQLTRQNIIYASLTGFLVGQLAIVFSFIPISPTVFSLFMTAFYYSLIGLIYNHLDQRLFRETVREYLIVLIFVFIIAILSVNW